jgi:hypothetical protein
MAPGAPRREAAAMPYRYMIVGEDGLGTELLGGLAALLSATLDEGERYRERAWRTLRPAYRIVALAGDGAPVGQASCFWVACHRRSGCWASATSRSLPRTAGDRWRARCACWRRPRHGASTRAPSWPRPRCCARSSPISSSPRRPTGASSGRRTASAPCTRLDGGRAYAAAGAPAARGGRLLAQRRAASTGLSNSLATASMRTSSPRRPNTDRASRRRPMRLKPAFS